MRSDADRAFAEVARAELDVHACGNLRGERLVEGGAELGRLRHPRAETSDGANDFVVARVVERRRDRARFAVHLDLTASALRPSSLAACSRRRAPWRAIR